MKETKIKSLDWHILKNLMQLQITFIHETKMGVLMWSESLPNGYNKTLKWLVLFQYSTLYRH